MRRAASCDAGKTKTVPGVEGGLNTSAQGSATTRHVEDRARALRDLRQFAVLRAGRATARQADDDRKGALWLHF